MSSINQPLVMLVDDNDIDLFLNQKFLRVADVTDNVVAFQRAQDALDYLKRNADNVDMLPTCILLDIQMPIMNGFQFLEMFDEIPENVKNYTQIYMLSSSTDPVDVSRAAENQHVVKILQKPLNPAELKVELRNCA